jgi:hypothetical protein
MFAGSTMQLSAGLLFNSVTSAVVVGYETARIRLSWLFGCIVGQFIVSIISNFSTVMMYRQTSYSSQMGFFVGLASSNPSNDGYCFVGVSCFKITSVLPSWIEI